MSRRWGRGKRTTRPPNLPNESVNALGLGAAAVGGGVSGIVSTGANATIVQQRGVFVTAEALGSTAPIAGEDRLLRGPLVVGDVPQEPPAFQPREDLVAELGARHAGVSVVHAVTGMRGVGKTQLAAAYARSCLAAGWRLVAWVDARDTASVLAGLGVVAAALGIRAEDTDAASLARMVRHRLEADGQDCLVVFDDAVDVDGLRPFLPAAGAAQVVITSTRQAAGNLGRAVAVNVFTEVEALAFLAARTGLDDEAGAQELAREMGRLPLGLAQAAAVIARQRLRYDTYLERLREVRLDDYLERVEGDPYPHRVAEAVVLSLQAAEAADPCGTGRAVMDLMAILSAAGISRAILHSAAATGIMSLATRLGRIGKGRGAKPEGMSEAEADAAIGRLAEWSLLTFSVDGSAISAHQLIMRVVREVRVADGTFAGLAALAADLLANLSDAVASRIWEHPTAAWEVVEQITALHDHTAGHLGDSATGVTKNILQLRQRTVWLVSTLADNPALAVSIGLPLVADCEQILGTDHPDTLMARNNLATVYQETGRLDKAIPLFERTLADRDRVLGADHPMALTSRNNLAGAYREAGRLDEAIPLYEAALTGRGRVLGADDPETLATCSNLAIAYQEAGRQDEAITLLERTRADAERVQGADHPRTLTSRNNVAAAYRAAGRLDEAVALLKDVLADRERVLGTDHHETLGSRINLAFAYQDAGQVDQAVALFEEVVADAERVLGADHPTTLSSRINLAGAYQAAGRLDEAIRLFVDVLADAERVLGADHPRTLGSRTYLAGAYQAAGRLDEAIPLFVDVLTDAERVLGADHPTTLTFRTNLAGACYEAERLGEAIQQYERIIADNQRILGSDDPETLNSRNNLAIAYGAAGQLDEAMPLLDRTLADSERVLGSDDRATLTLRINLAGAYLDARQPNKAIPLFERALADSERVLGSDHPLTKTVRNATEAAAMQFPEPQDDTR